MRRLTLLACALAGAAPAYAGGNFTDVAAGPGTVWVAGNFGIDQLDARTGAVRRQIVLGPFSPTAIGFAGGAAWIAGITSEYGTILNRIDDRSGRPRRVLQDEWFPQQLAVGGKSVWLLQSRRSTYRVVRFDLSGRVESVVSTGGAGGWLTADASHAWLCCQGRTLLKIDRDGGLRSTFSLPTDGPVWAAAGSIWFRGAGVLDRFDLSSGRTLARLPLVDTRDLSVSGNSVYALGALRLVRIDAGTNRVLARTWIPGITQSVSANAGGVWVTSVGRPATSRVLRADPRTLRIELRRSLEYG